MSEGEGESDALPAAALPPSLNHSSLLGGSRLACSEDAALDALLLPSGNQEESCP